MTGFGKSDVEINDKKIIIEIKSLNSKALDLSIKIPHIYKEWEMDIRSIAKEKIVRGKAEICVYYDTTESIKEVKLNKDFIKNYFDDMSIIATELGITNNDADLFNIAVRHPDAQQTKANEVNEDDWLALKTAIEKAINNLNNFRIQEGEALIKDISTRITNIQLLSQEVEKWENERIETVKQRLYDKLTELEANIDQNRFEQELIFYIEKFDITEEKIRLANHCKYFLSTSETEENTGRKLGFIAQEIGREINTMGSKANHHEIQKIVVDMKDELEKIKEQILNLM